MPAAKPVWKARTSKEPDALILALCAGRDVRSVPPADTLLLPHDLHLNIAHALMLGRQRIVDRPVLRRLLRGLRTLESRAAKGEFPLDPSAEDVHINVEQALESLAGKDAAGRLHSARSRNDQSSTDIRLWLRVALLTGLDQTAALAEALAKRARGDAALVCPGFTHMQPAMVTTLGHLWLSHAHALLRDLHAMLACWPVVNRCPLGAAASYGTDWPIDREWVASALGFDGPETNTADAIAARWEIEARVAQAWTLMLMHLATLAADVIWMSTPPRSSLRLDDAHVTGSSIMPQKRNPDLAEVTRARAAACQAHTQAILGTAHGLITGYNRDFQWTKYHIMDAFWQIDAVPEGWRRIITGLTADRGAMRRACEIGFMESAEVADHIARRMNLPFRRLHGVLATAATACEGEGRLTLGAVNGALVSGGIRYQLAPGEWQALQDPGQRVAQRRHTGSPAPVEVRRDAARVAEALAGVRRTVAAHRRRIDSARRRLDGLVRRQLG